jgi:putative aldouronate transport system substrate-binding protein
MPGTKYANTDDIIDEVNKRTMAVLDTKIKIEFSQGQELGKNIQTKLSSGEKLDIVIDQYANFRQMVFDGKYAQLDELLNQYGQQIIKIRPNEMWDANKINGKVMGIPLENTFRPAQGTWYIRKDLREKLGFKPIQTNEEFVKYLYAVKEKEPGMVVSATDNFYLYFPGQNRVLLSSKGKIRTTPALEYSYVLYFSDNDGKVHNMFDEKNEVIWNEFLNARKLFADKITFESNLSISMANEKLNLLRDGRLAAYYGAIDENSYKNIVDGLKKKISDADLETFTEAVPDLKYVSNFKVRYMACIPESSKYKDNAVLFLNWANQRDNYNLMVLGVEGVDWVSDGTYKFKSLKNPLYLQTMIMLVMNPTYFIYPSSTTDAYINEYKKYQDPKNYTKDILSGFEFDPTKVSSELQKCQNLHNSNYSYIVNGSADPEVSWESFSKSAYDTVKAIQLELQRQIDQYLKGK